MEKQLARIISLIFHPLFIPTYLIASLVFMNAFFALVLPNDAKLKIILLVFMTSALFPVIVLFGMYRFRLVTSIKMDNREERLYPYVATSIFFFLTYYLVWKANLSPVFYYCLLGASILAVLTLLINFRWKISAHTVSIGGVIGAFFGLQSVLYVDMLLQLSVSILIAGLVGYARLKAGKHTQAQVYAGYFLGFAVLYLLIMYY